MSPARGQSTNQRIHRDKLTEVKVLGLKLAERVEQSFFSAEMVGVVELGRQEEGLAGDVRSFDTVADLALVGVGGGGIDMLVTVLQRGFHGSLDGSWLALPSAYASLLDYESVMKTIKRTETEGGHFSASVEFDCGRSRHDGGGRRERMRLNIYIEAPAPIDENSGVSPGQDLRSGFASSM